MKKRDHIPRCKCGKAVYAGGMCYAHFQMRPNPKKPKSVIPAGFFVPLD